MTDLIVVQRSPTILVADGPAVPVPHALTHGPAGTDPLSALYASLAHASQHAPGGADPTVDYERRSRALLLAACGYTGENFPRQAYVGATSNDPPSGRALYQGLQMMAGQTLTSLIVGVEQAGVGLTLTKLAIWDTALNLLAISGDVKASFASVGVKVVNMLVPYLAAIDTALIAGYLSTGTTGPGISRTSNAATGIGSNGLISGALIGRAARQDSLSDLPATPVPARDGNATCIWMGWK